LLAAFYWENVSKTGAYASILTGILVGILSYLYFGEKGGYTIYWAFYGIPAIFFVGFCFSKIFKNRKI
jgi:Na+/proline symporter